jgi:hypothetical protein
MFQSLLAERFNLKVSRQSKVLPVLVLAVAKDGPKLTENTGRFGMDMGRSKLTIYGCEMNTLADGLGLKLESRKMPIQFIVIDHIDRPSEN